MPETIAPPEGTSIHRVAFYIQKGEGMALLPFPTEDIEVELQRFIDEAARFRIADASGKLDTSGEDILTLNCSDGVCNCAVSPEGKLLSHEFVSSALTYHTFANIKFPGEESIGDFLTQHLTGTYKYGEKIRLIFSDGTFVVKIGVSSCEKEMATSSDVVSATRSAVSGAIS